MPALPRQASQSVRDTFSAFANRSAAPAPGAAPRPLPPPPPSAPLGGTRTFDGRDWVRANEPRPIVEILERVYGATALQGLNPTVLLRS